MDHGDYITTYVLDSLGSQLDGHSSTGESDIL